MSSYDQTKPPTKEYMLEKRRQERKVISWDIEDLFNKPLAVILRELIVTRKDFFEASPHIAMPQLRRAILESLEAHILETGGRVVGYNCRYPYGFKGEWE